MALNSAFEDDDNRNMTLKEIFLENVGDDARIPVPEFRRIMTRHRAALAPSVIQKITNYMDKNNDGYVTADEADKIDRQSTREAAKAAGVKLSEMSMFRRGASFAADIVLVNDQQKQTYADQYTCCPPPLFIPLISAAQFALYCYYSATSNAWLEINEGVVNSPLTYHPNRRYEAWRFLSYMLVHAGLEHILFNVIMQLLLGIPLEMVHGSLRIGGLYLGGVIAGSLATSIFDSSVALVGGSGGVYALLAAHIANVILNGDIMNFLMKVLRVFVIILLIGADFGYAAYKRFNQSVAGGRVSFVAHVAGAVTGVTLGLVLLKNFKVSLAEKVFFWISVVAYAAFIIFSVFWNIFYPDFPPSVY